MCRIVGLRHRIFHAQLIQCIPMFFQVILPIKNRLPHAVKLFLLFLLFQNYASLPIFLLLFIEFTDITSSTGFAFQNSFISSAIPFTLSEKCCSCIFVFSTLSFNIHFPYNHENSSVSPSLLDVLSEF